MYESAGNAIARHYRVSSAETFFWRCAILYRFVDEADQLLYVGSTINWTRREAQHRSQSFWWPLVTRILVVEYPTAEAALEAEEEAVRTENPLANRLWSGASEATRMLARAELMERVASVLRERYTDDAFADLVAELHGG